MAIGKLELRKRNESFNKRSGTKTPTVSSSKDVDGVETVEDFDKKTVIPKWAVVTLCFCVFGGVVFEMMQMIVTFMAPAAVTK